MKLSPKQKKERIEDIAFMLKKLDDDEMIQDTYNQLLVHYREYRILQNKLIETTMFDVDNFFEGIGDDLTLNEKFKAKD